MAIVGIISDTHGLLRDETIEALKKSDLILHAGDLGSREILEQLEHIAPVAAVRGNVDTDPWAALDRDASTCPSRSRSSRSKRVEWNLRLFI